MFKKLIQHSSNIIVKNSSTKYQNLSYFSRRTYRTQRCQSLFQNHSSKNSNKNNKNYIYLGGFSLGFLGFLNKEEDADLETIEDKILMKIKRAILAISRDQVKKAENYLSVAWQMSEQEGREDVKTQIIDIQANLALQTGNLERAEELLKITAQRLVGMGKVSNDDNAIVELSIKLSQIYALQNKMNEALLGLEFCNEIQQKKIDNGINDEDTLVLASWAKHNLSQLYINLSISSSPPNEEMANKASRLINEAYNLVSKVLGPESEKALLLQIDSATHIALRGKFDEALSKIKSLEEITKDKNDYLCACLRINRGNIYLQKGDYEGAKLICEEAKEFAVVANDPETIQQAEECVAKSIKMKQQKVKN